MRLLLDTHAFLWFVLENPRLSSTARDVIADPNNDIEVSPATYWEIAIKISIGKYALPEPFADSSPRPPTKYTKHAKRRKRSTQNAAHFAV